MLSVLPDSAERYLREPERMVNDAMQCAQVMSTAPEPYFDPVLVRRRRTYLELVRLLARRGVVRSCKLLELMDTWGDGTETNGDA